MRRKAWGAALAVGVHVAWGSPGTLDSRPTMDDT